MNYNRIFSNVFKWMFIGLLVSFGTSLYVASNETMLMNIYSTGTYWIITIFELILVIALSALVNKLSYMSGIVLYLLYCFTSGLTLSSICYVYDLTSVFYTFMATAIMFGLMALYGHKTNKDLTKLGTILLFALIPILLVSIINIFIGNEVIEIIVSVIIILIFCGVTAYDIQKIKNIYIETIPKDNLAIYGALQLYLDYINIFLQLIKYIGKER